MGTAGPRGPTEVNACHRGLSALSPLTVKPRVRALPPSSSPGPCFQYHEVSVGDIEVTEKVIWSALIPSTEASMLNSSSAIFLAEQGCREARPPELRRALGPPGLALFHIPVAAEVLLEPPGSGGCPGS